MNRSLSNVTQLNSRDSTTAGTRCVGELAVKLGQTQHHRLSFAPSARPQRHVNGLCRDWGTSGSCAALGSEVSRMLRSWWRWSSVAALHRSLAQLLAVYDQFHRF